MPASPKSPGHHLLLALAPACVLALLVLGTFLKPAPEGHGTHTQLGLPPCISMQVFDFPCPGCGVTTSAALAARGKFSASLHTQPLGLLLSALAALYPIWALDHALRGRDLQRILRKHSPRPWIIGACVAVLASWIYKLASMA